MRRYARALTGSQDSGDACVAAVIEALIADSKALPDFDDKRIALYRMLSTIWSGNFDKGDPTNGAETWEKTTALRLASLPPAARQAFLLVSVEGFTEQETAQILEVDADQLQALLETATSDIAEQVATDVLIIEDEPMIAMEIEQLAVGLGHNITAITRTHAEAIASFKNQRPGLVLADIRLADGSSGIDAVNEIFGATDTPPPVIFITAYPEMLLTGERPEPTFLITKPFSPEMVKALISQALFFENNSSETA
jgi:CheY-like chemotaxis protein